jgi:uridine kinase
VGTVLLFQHDAYYFDLSFMPDPNPANINYDHPDSLETSLCVSHLQCLKHGEEVRQPIYDFSTHRRLDETKVLEPLPIILVEGILVLAEPLLRSEMDMRIYVDAEPDIRLLRRMERDITNRGRTVQSVRDQYYATVRPMFEQFVAPSKQHADIIVPHGGENAIATELLVGFLHGELEKRNKSQAAKS